MKRTQKQRLIDLLSDGKWHNTIEMNKIAFRYGAIIHVLRKEGYCLQKERDWRFPDNLIEKWMLADKPMQWPAIRPLAKKTERLTASRLEFIDGRYVEVENPEIADQLNVIVIPEQTSII